MNRNVRWRAIAFVAAALIAAAAWLLVRRFREATFYPGALIGGSAMVETDAACARRTT